MVKVESLSLSLGNAAILKDLTFALNPGRVTVLLGPNGSGKTSLLRVLSSYYRRYEGKVVIYGQNLVEAKDAERSFLHSSLSQEHPGVRLTLEELLSFSNDRKKASSTIRELGLETLQNKMLEEMSGGERTLSYLALLYSQNSALYLMDEPDASLDPKARKLLFSVIQELRARDRSVLVSMHDLNRAMLIADDILVLEQGKIAFSGTKEQFLASTVPSLVFGMETKRMKDEEGKELELFL